MSNLFAKVKDVIRDAVEYHGDSTSSVFKFFISAVLIQFAVLSLISIGTANQVQDLGPVEQVIKSAHYWWGLLGLLGSASLLFEKYIKGNLAVLVAGYAAAISSLALLSYDFVTTKPPVHTGGILAATAVVFLGGLLYGRVKRR